MIELPLIFVAGILGSAHCLGMCGGFALAVGGRATTWQENAARQFLYTSGRVFTYAVLGAIAGYSGLRVTSQFPALLSLPAVLSLVAGGVLIYQGLLAAGWLPQQGLAGQPACVASSLFASFITGPSWLQAFLAGVFTGLLPCGLLYGMVALAASTRAILPGMAVMMIFGLGTAPAMVLAGFSRNLLGLAWRKPLFKLAAICLIVTGAVSMTRGATLLLAPSPSSAACPFCPP